MSYVSTFLKQNKNLIIFMRSYFNLAYQYFCPDNVVCILCLLHILQFTSDKILSWKQTLWTLIRLQSDLGPYCLQYWLLKNISRQEEQTTKVLTGRLRVKEGKHLSLDIYSVFKAPITICRE